MKVIVAEKISVAHDIMQALNERFEKKEGYYQSSNYCVTWCYGHLLKSVEPEGYDPSYKTWDLSQLPLKLFPLKYEPIEKSANQTKIVCDLLVKSDLIIHAGDPDDEGQLLVDELIEYSGAKAPVKRLLINDPTIPAIKKAFGNLKDNKEFYGIYQKALARQTGDMIYGLSLTRAMTLEGKNRGHDGVLSIGRVQTPILWLITKRYEENKNHKESYFYTLTGCFNQKDINFSANWQPSKNAPLDEKNRLIDKSYGENIAKDLKGALASIQTITTQEKNKQPPLPYNLVRLQQVANKKYKLTAKETLDITQALREKYKAISYNRSDCSYLSNEQHAESPEIIQALANKLTSENFSKLSFDPKIKSAAFNDKKISAHTAIIPTINVPDLNKLTEQEKQIYLLITIQYLAQFLPAMRYNEIVVLLNVKEEVFKTQATQIIEKGFLEILSEEEEVEESEEELSSFDVLKSLQKDNQTYCEKIDINQKKTSPPSLFTEATLLAALVRISDFVTNPKIKAALKEKDKDKAGENGGIGTPATRADIIELLKKRQFIEVKKGKIVPTEKGNNFINMLPTIIAEPDLTALWVEKQQDIASNKLEVKEFVEEVYLVIEEILQDLDCSPLGKLISKTENELLCPKCKQPLIFKPKLVCCSNKECNFIIWRKICQKMLTDKQLTTLIKEGKTPVIKGLTSKNGKTFDAAVELDPDTYTTTLEFS